MAQKVAIQETLATETFQFIQRMPYWLKFLSVKLIEEGELNDEELKDAFHS